MIWICNTRHWRKTKIFISIAINPKMDSKGVSWMGKVKRDRKKQNQKRTKKPKLKNPNKKSDWKYYGCHLFNNIVYKSLYIFIIPTVTALHVHNVCYVRHFCINKSVSIWTHNAAQYTKANIFFIVINALEKKPQKTPKKPKKP